MGLETSVKVIEPDDYQEQSREQVSISVNPMFITVGTRCSLGAFGGWYC